LDALVAPGLVLAGHPFDQRGDLRVDGWATGTVWVGPFHQAAVPAQDCGRSDQAVRADDGSDRQIEYYRALAPEYLDNELDEPGAEELLAAVEEHAPGGTALELACGPGTWTPLLLRRASHVTAVDAAAEMLALARARVGADHRRVRFVRADLFDWQPPFSASAAAPTPS
jgi:hypothetical protein